MAPIDNAAAIVVQKLRREHTPTLDDAERTALALFMNSLIERSPRLLVPRDAAAPDHAAEVTQRILARAPTDESRARLQEVYDQFDLNAMARNVLREYMAREIRDGTVIAYLKTLRWRVICVDSGIEFVTTDAPLLINIGDGDAPIQMMSLPISPKRLLVMTPQEWAIEPPLWTALVAIHNLRLMGGDGRFLYSCNQLRDDEHFKFRDAAEAMFGIGSTAPR